MSVCMISGHFKEDPRTRQWDLNVIKEGKAK